VPKITKLWQNLSKLCLEYSGLFFSWTRCIELFVNNILASYVVLKVVVHLMTLASTGSCDCCHLHTNGIKMTIFFVYFFYSHTAVQASHRLQILLLVRPSWFMSVAKYIIKLISLFVNLVNSAFLIPVPKTVGKLFLEFCVWLISSYISQWLNSSYPAMWSVEQDCCCCHEKVKF